MFTHIHQTFLSFIDFFSIFVTWKGCVRNWRLLVLFQSRTLPIPIYGLSALWPKYPILSFSLDSWKWRKYIGNWRRWAGAVPSNTLSALIRSLSLFQCILVFWYFVFLFCVSHYVFLHLFSHIPYSEYYSTNCNSSNTRDTFPSKYMYLRLHYFHQFSMTHS